MSRKQLEVGPASPAGDFARDSWMIFTPSDILLEIDVLAQLLGLPKKLKTEIDWSDDEWAEIVMDLTSRLGPVPGSGIRAASPASPSDLDALGWKVGQLRRALRDAGKIHDETGASTGLLLPASFARRVEYMFGFGGLPIAWVRRLNVRRY